MNRWLVCLSLICLSAAPSALLAQRQSWNPKALQEATPPWQGAQSQPQINVDIKEGVDEFEFVQATNDPFVYTKAYVLKHASPYAVRNYLLTCVQSKRLADNNTRVECIRYNDGTGMVLVSAEDYRFDAAAQPGGMSIDELVAFLDRPDFMSFSGTPRYVYFPKFMPASNLKQMIDRVGISYKHPEDVNLYSNDSVELEYNYGFTSVDNGLNLLYLYVPNYDVKQAVARLEIYDIPVPEIVLDCVVYEIDDEKDGKLGADFQSWKNGPGADAFSLGGRWRRGWNPATGLPSNARTGATKYIQFSPRWNSKYLDLLGADSHAKVLTSGSLRILNQGEGRLTAKTKIPYFDGSESVGTGGIGIRYSVLADTDFYPDDAAAPQSGYRVIARDRNGNRVTIDRPFSGGMVLAETVVETSGETIYSMEFPAGEGGANFVRQNQALGHKASNLAGIDFSVARFDGDRNAFVWTPFTPSFDSDIGMSYDRGAKITSAFYPEGGGGYGYSLKVSPNINLEASLLSIDLENVSLLGFQSDGSVRTAKSEIKTQVMVDNAGGRVVIGGIEKRYIVRSVTKVPWLGSLPLIGWVLGSEGESVKRSRLVTVIESRIVRPGDHRLTPGVRDAIENIEQSIPNPAEDDWKDPNYGFDQFHFDKKKRALEPLP